jgi:hypothetical protein
VARPGTTPTIEAEAIPSAKLVTVEEVKHMGDFEHYGRFAAAVSGFAESCVRPVTLVSIAPVNGERARVDERSVRPAPPTRRRRVGARRGRLARLMST